MSEVKEALIKARALIKDHGWVQNQPGSHRDGFCMIGALAEICPMRQPDVFFEAVDALRDTTGYMHVTSFNDAEGRTKEEVIQAFDRAIEATE